MPRIVTVRHGERVDFTFTDDWIKYCFDSDGNYSRQNLNQPETVPKREGSPQTFIRDTPLTEVGCLQAKLVGKGLHSEKLLSNNFEVFVSPSLRCIETATGILKGMGLEDVKLNIEPSLFEWTQWYVGHMPFWMTTDELIAAGFKINEAYEPLIKLEELKEGESVSSYYERSHKLVLHLLETQGNKDILLVAHGSSLDTNSRQLLGYPIRSEQEMLGVLRGIPYCGVGVMEEDPESHKWSLLDVPKLHICHAPVYDFDARKTLYESSANDLPFSSAPNSVACGRGHT